MIIILNVTECHARFRSPKFEERLRKTILRLILKTRNESELIKNKNCKQLLWNFRAVALHGVAAVNWFQLRGG